jgi:predicted Holliday junction resolvase-like endonuclease
METTRKVSVIVGLLLLIGFIVSVIVIYQGGSSRSSYRSTVEESWKQREMRMKVGYRREVKSVHMKFRHWLSKHKKSTCNGDFTV